jgi:hypothetical protein
MYFNLSFNILARKLATTQITLAQNFREKDADFE